MFSRTNKSYIFLIILVVVGALFFICLNNGRVQKITIPESIPLTVSQYKMFHDELIGMVNEQDPRVAMEYLHKMSRTNPSLMRSCHVLVHDIGRAAY